MLESMMLRCIPDASQEILTIRQSPGRDRPDDTLCHLIETMFYNWL